MESFFNADIDTNISTDNILYNIINSYEPKYTFLYCTIIILGIFISGKISYDSNMLVGLIFCSIIIYYIYTWKKYNTLTKVQIDKEKFDKLCTKNKILYKYPKIVDFLFYMENFKSNNLKEFTKLITLFENFTKLYEYCLINNKLIDPNYKVLIDLKITILNTINNFTFTLYSNGYDDILVKHKISAENIIDELLGNLIVLYKKQKYYNGYDNASKILNTSNVLAYNILYDNNYREHYNNYNVSNLIFF
jgi:hypothetical protein